MKRELELGYTIIELRDELVRGEFHVDFVRAELIADGDGTRFVGPGYVKQDRAHGFEIKLYVQGKMPADVLAPFMTGSTTAGKLFTKRDYYSLVGSDEAGRRWKAGGIVRPPLSGHVGEKGHLVVATCYEIAVDERWPGATGTAGVALFTPHSFEFPANSSTHETSKIGSSLHSSRSRWNVAEFTCRGFEFMFENNNGVTVKASSEASFHTQIERRVSEAVAFCFGILPEWFLVARWACNGGSTMFRSPAKRAKKPRQLPPCVFPAADNSESVWNMFALYFSHVLADDASPCHPLSRSVMGIAQTRDSTAEGQALAVAVEVESVLSKFFEGLGAPDESFVAGVNSLLVYIDNWPGDKSLLARVKGSIRDRKRVGPRDRLKALVQQRRVGESESEAWIKLRNVTAHGDWEQFEGNLQGLLDLTGKVTGLFNQLVFCLIGYSGKQTDYGVQGWPTIDYPPTPSHTTSGGGGTQPV